MRVLLAVGAVVSLAGCASIVSGTSQDITVITNPPGAECVLSRNGAEIGRIALTPGTIPVEKSRYDLTIACVRPDFIRTQQINLSGVDPWTYGNIAIGIAFFGGFIGRGIDHATGASNHYDTEVTIDLVPATTATATEAVPPPAPPEAEAPN